MTGLSTLDIQINLCIDNEGQPIVRRCISKTTSGEKRLVKATIGNVTEVYISLGEELQVSVGLVIVYRPDQICFRDARCSITTILVLQSPLPACRSAVVASDMFFEWLFEHFAQAHITYAGEPPPRAWPFRRQILSAPAEALCQS